MLIFLNEMVISCSAYGCTNRWRNENKLRFHRFPLKNPELLRKWVIATRRKSWTPTNSSFLCSEHFSLESYRSNAKRYLKRDAVPSIFNFWVPLQKPSKKRSVIVKHASPNRFGNSQFQSQSKNKKKNKKTEVAPIPLQQHAINFSTPSSSVTESKILKQEEETGSPKPNTVLESNHEKNCFGDSQFESQCKNKKKVKVAVRPIPLLQHVPIPLNSPTPSPSITESQILKQDEETGSPKPNALLESNHQEETVSTSNEDLLRKIEMLEEENKSLREQIEEKDKKLSLFLKAASDVISDIHSCFKYPDDTIVHGRSCCLHIDNIKI